MQFDRLILIGYRGTGKTSVGRLLAAEFGWTCVDADEEIEREAGISIARIFSEQGEPTFRDLEERIVAEQVERRSVVLSLGGGAILRERTRERIAQAGPVVWLMASPRTLAERLSADPTTAGRRPSLTGRGPVAEIEQVLEMRTPLYRGCATLAVDTEGRTVAQVAQTILDHLRLPAPPI